MVKLVDAVDSKSTPSNRVLVQVRSSAISLLAQNKIVLVAKLKAFFEKWIGNILKINWFVKKKIGSKFLDTESEHHGLKRHLTSFHLIAIGIGAIIGAGIFVITGQAAAQFAGPGIALSFIIAAFICMLAGLCYAELSASMPVSGGAYSYAYAALGEFPAWLVACAFMIQYMISSATVAVGWSGYFVSFLADFGLHLPVAFSGAPLVYDAVTGWGMSGAVFNVPAVLIVMILSVLIMVGIKAAAHFNNVMVVIKLCTIALFIVLGFFYVKAQNWTPFIPENTGVFGDFGWSGVLRAAGLVFFAYIGFDTVSTLAQDAVNPQRDLPVGILGSLAICTGAYIATALVLTGVAGYASLNVPDPMSVALNVMGPHLFWIKFLVKIAILAGLASVVLVQMLGLTRVFLAISKDGLLPKSLSKLHPKTRTPVRATFTIAGSIMVVSGLFSVEILGSLVSMSALFIFAIVCAGVWILRHTHPDLERPFKVPFVPFVPLLGIVTCFGQMCFLPLATWIQMLIWFGLGVVFYYFYGLKNSRLRLDTKES